ncbi:type II toxin-antitoxin system RelE/ParE family toxin [Neorhizobium huautlense]|uniref:type II toxin-antitoxin system RelE/ParE family toxin n=1 Tax=Neorhizobium huautlense TaxID=67774 RepID=UPI0027D87A04|nr:type II toxin-antitoxin system RelE/ParE family toxin [Neorhizobium huautlense]
MKVRFSRQARADLAEITAVISRDNPRRAETYTDELEAACTGLSDTPEAFQVFRRRNGQEIRRRPYGNYVILYRINGRHVDILRIIHGARNYQRLFPPPA